MLTISIDQDVYAPGDKVLATLCWSNETDAPLEVSFPSSQRFDAVIEAQGKLFWRCGASRLFPQIPATLLILPGDSRVFKFECAAPESGSYTIHA